MENTCFASRSGTFDGFRIHSLSNLWRHLTR
jgi:hypothetical protein